MQISGSDEYMKASAEYGKIVDGGKMDGVTEKIELERRLTRLEAGLDSVADVTGEIKQDVKGVGDAVGKLSQSFAILSKTYCSYDDIIKDHDNRLKNIESKPGKRWDKVVDYTMTFIIGALLGVIITIFTGG